MGQKHWQDGRGERAAARLEGLVTNRLDPLLAHPAHWFGDDAPGIDLETRAKIEGWGTSDNLLELDYEGWGTESHSTVNWREDPGGDFYRRWYGQN